MNDYVALQPLWLQIWLIALVGINFAAILFVLKDWRPRIIVLAFVLVALMMGPMFAKFGYTRILGLVHVIVWTPLMAYLWKTRNNYPAHIWTNRYVYVFMLIVGMSLVIDYVDVIRYLLGDTGVVNA